MQIPNNSYEIVKTQYFKGIVTPITETKAIRMPDGRDIQVRAGDNFIQYEQGFYEIIRGNIDLNNGTYSKYIEGKIVKDVETKIEDTNIIIPIPLHHLMSVEERTTESNEENITVE